MRPRLVAVGVGLVATVLSFVAVFGGSGLDFLVVGALLFGLAGLWFGVRRPVLSWEWGLWLSLPMWALLFVLTIWGGARQASRVERVLPPLTALLSASLAAAAGSRWARRRGGNGQPDGGDAGSRPSPLLGR